MIGRADVISALVSRIRDVAGEANMPGGLRLVKAFEGDLDGLSGFIDTSRAILPGAYVVSDGVSESGSRGRSLKVTHTLAVLVCFADYSGRIRGPAIYPVLDALITGIHGHAPDLQGAGEFRFDACRRQESADAAAVYRQTYKIPAAGF